MPFRSMRQWPIFVLIDRTVRAPDERRPDPRPDRERFFRRERGVWVLAVVEFAADRAPT
jgi:hypothetical protein